MRLRGRDTSAANGQLDAVAAGATAAFGAPSGAARELLRVESRLRAVAESADQRLAELALHGIEAGGKRLRPLLAIAAAMAAGGRAAVSERVVDAAVAVELVHLASLYHDDVLDAAGTRRGRASANARWGERTAVLGGDVLLAHAYRVAAGLGRPQLQRLGETLADLCAGQIAETDAAFDRRRTIPQYDASIRRKTASLLSASCWLGASAAGADPAVAATLGRYGTHLGVAFQIADDLLDLYGSDRALGKPAGSDLRAGVYTLPVLMALRDDPTLAELLVDGIDERGVAEVARRVHASGADRRAAASARDHLHAAFAQLRDGALRPDGIQLLAALTELVPAPLEQLGLAGRPHWQAPFAPALAGALAGAA